jgi:PAS domain S-box-containing protein
MEALAAAVPALLALARNVPLLVLSRTGTVVGVTEAAERALGVRGVALVGRRWQEICSDPHARTLEYIELCARTLQPIPGAFHAVVDAEATRFRCEGYAVTLAGETTPLVVLQIRRQEQDRFILLGQKLEELNIEVLRRRQSERELAATQARLSAVLEQMPAGVMIAESPSGRTVFSNEQARSIFGGSIAADAADDYSAAFTAWHPDGREFASADFPLVRALRGDVVTGAEVRFRRADGRTAVVRANAAPIRDENGAIVAAVTAYYDISEQKQLEQIMLAARAEAETANRTKDEFLAMLGHELRNPLAPILTALHLMQLRGVGAEKERTIIDRQVKHLARLVDDLLDVSRITSGKIALKKERVELGAVVARAIEMASPLLEKRGIDLVLSLPAVGLPVEADPARLAQVVCNLFTNAAKYSEQRGNVWVTGRQEADQVVLTVRDSGIGIAPEMLPRIFDWFVQERQALDRSQGGLGLGLAIVRSLVALHGGTVSVASGGKAQGSEFTVRLPLAGTRQPAPAIEGLAALRPEPVASAGLRVMVVDDNEDGAETLSEALECMGCATRVAHDGPAALRMAKEFRPQVALLDIGLPAMDGYELAERLRNEPELADIALVAITGYGQESDRARSRQAGFDAHLVKPVDIEQLAALVRELRRPDDVTAGACGPAPGR